MLGSGVSCLPRGRTRIGMDSNKDHGFIMGQFHWQLQQSRVNIIQVRIFSSFVSDTFLVRFQKTRITDLNRKVREIPEEATSPEINITKRDQSRMNVQQTQTRTRGRTLSDDDFSRRTRYSQQ
ncbi:unnamed protein product [Ixodes pacificus]